MFYEQRLNSEDDRQHIRYKESFVVARFPSPTLWRRVSTIVVTTVTIFVTGPIHFSFSAVDQNRQHNEDIQSQLLLG